MELQNKILGKAIYIHTGYMYPVCIAVVKYCKKRFKYYQIADAASCGEPERCMDATAASPICSILKISSGCISRLHTDLIGWSVWINVPHVYMTCKLYL